MKISKLIKRLTKRKSKQEAIDRMIDEYPGYFVPGSEIRAILRRK